MQDPNPLPWGAQDRFQAHFIVQQFPDGELSSGKELNHGVYVVLHEPDLKPQVTLVQKK